MLKKNGVLKMKFEISGSKDGQYFFRIKSSNGEILAHSEGYHNLTDCHNAIELIQKGAETAEVKKISPQSYIW